MKIIALLLLLLFPFMLTACSQSQTENQTANIGEIVKNAIKTANDSQANGNNSHGNTSNNTATINKQITIKPFYPIIESAEIPKATKLLTCKDITANSTIKIKGHTRLTDQCDLTGKSVKFVLDKSNTSLDCRGARLSQAKGDTSKKSAVTIRPKKNQAIANITVANCHSTGYAHALHIMQKTRPNARYLQGITDIASNQKTAPHDIRIINVSSNQSMSSGIYVDDHSYKVHFSDLLVRGSGTVGLYFEFGTQNNRVENSVFVDNGFRTFKPDREAIAVDSSAGNMIVNNQFIHNGLGGIMLYRNCFEYANDSSRGNHFKRTQSSRDNLIQDNTFINEPVGVWVASRQSRNLIGFQCGAYLVKKTLTARYHLDSAKDNQIIGNRFVDVMTGVIVEDDGTKIQDNTFTSTPIAIKVGSKIREEITTEHGGAVKNTTIKGNVLNGAKVQVRQASKGSTLIE